MFKSTRLNKLFEKTSVNGVEVVIQLDGTFVFNLVCLKKEKSSIVTEKQKSGIKNIEDLKSELDLKAPFVIVLNGKGIINKKIACKENNSVKVLLNKVLPNASESEFCIQITPIDESNAFVSVIRSSSLNEILGLFNSNKLANIRACYLGPFVLNTCIEFVEKKALEDGKLTFLNYQFDIIDHQIADLNSVESSIGAGEITIGDDKVESASVIAFAAAFSCFVSVPNGVLNSQELDAALLNYNEKRKFEIRGWAFLISVFALLLINFLFFSNYWNKNNEITSQLELNKSSLNRVDTLKKELSQKKVFLEQNGLLENSMTSFYADRLASSLPNSITWTNLDIHPIKKKEVNDESDVMYFENKIIRITGNCMHSTDLNDWMKQVKSKDWVKKIELLNYQQDNAKDNGLFLLEIVLK